MAANRGKPGESEHGSSQHGRYDRFLSLIRKVQIVDDASCFMQKNIMLAGKPVLTYTARMPILKRKSLKEPGTQYAIARRSRVGRK